MRARALAVSTETAAAPGSIRVPPYPSVDNSVRITGDDHKARVSLAQYIARAPFSLEKLRYEELTGKALYHSTSHWVEDLARKRDSPATQTC